VTIQSQACRNKLHIFYSIGRKSVLTLLKQEELASDDLKQLIGLYILQTLTQGNPPPIRFLNNSANALEALERCNSGENFFSIIVDDIKIPTRFRKGSSFFKLASGHQNICVVGDDDQALYRFGAQPLKILAEFLNDAIAI
jgi:DNA helicase-2/ATP-dependent DNA helicase PcrA